MVAKTKLYCDDGSHGGAEVPAVKERTVHVCAKCDTRIEAEERKYAGAHTHDDERRKRKAPGITGDRLLTLIRREPGQHPREYASRLKVTGSNVSQVANRLRKRGLIRVGGTKSGTRYWPVEEDTRTDDERQFEEDERRTLQRKAGDPGDAARQAAGYATAEGWSGARA